ncbi:MAG TPA: TetR family transcriptional regulator [Glaciihabitans sp.]|nr:TetR family transcriptional regulator [Glaciihabitans sp.]
MDSANDSKAAQRRRETASRLTAVCRRLTAEGGLAGFTIEEVCDEVGISRRTFFNYFPSKEEAVLGIVEGDEMHIFAEHFMHRGSRGWTAVVDDVIDLVIEHVDAAGLNVEKHTELVRAIEREPRLLARFMGLGRERDAEVAALISRREGVPVGDLKVQACIAVMSAVTRSAADRVLDPQTTIDFKSALTDSLAAIRAVLDTSPPRKAHQ